MLYKKHVVADDMKLCYAISNFNDGFVIGCEKEGPIRRFAEDGTYVETVAEGPGGVMTLLQVPGRDDQLMATWKFFSPNFGGDEAKIVSYTREADGTWIERTVCDLPYVHRFGLLKGADGTTWLIACSIKGACREVKEDWWQPGAVYAAPLPERLEDFDDEHQLKLQMIANAQEQNHGFYVAEDASYALIGTAAGAFKYVPPATKDGIWSDWNIKCLIVNPTSDMCAVDLDGDGKLEIVTISRFHGNQLSVWHEDAEFEGRYSLQWEDPEKRGFLHAIWSGELAGEASAVLGNRRDGRDLFRLYWDEKNATYALEFIDHDRGPTNTQVFTGSDGLDHIIAANRETNEVALYDVLPE